MCGFVTLYTRMELTHNLSLWAQHDVGSNSAKIWCLEACSILKKRIGTEVDEVKSLSRCCHYTFNIAYCSNIFFILGSQTANGFRNIGLHLSKKNRKCWLTSLALVNNKILGASNITGLLLGEAVI
ncbi:hypothetical protein FEM48_Zijuj02G0087500 [Ziziphus jujuba var. spinosa]|uniref:Uncharacterized protein n=1 Tax=Ziziphus jujuba var. spinosa TaxID=714518 RepID=A0A978VUS0_ZIZJJ|nr:hypothetical protein FEM48_Zijuj02G0087500 [Ziziphus jujuba var. spinosa]